MFTDITNKIRLNQIFYGMEMETLRHRAILSDVTVFFFTKELLNKKHRIELILDCLNINSQLFFKRIPSWEIQRI